MRPARVPLGRSGSAGPLLGRASLLRHSRLSQTGEISGLAKSTDCLSLITVVALRRATLE